MLKAYSWLCIQESLLPMLSNHKECWGQNPGRCMQRALAAELSSPKSQATPKAAKCENFWYTTTANEDNC